MDQRNNYVLPKATTSWFQQGLPSAVSVVVDDDSLSDSCFEDTTTAEDDEGESSHLQNADQLSNYWNDLGSAIKFIDESTRSSVAAESSSLSPSRAQSFTIPSTELDSHDTFRVRIRRYSSLTTLTLSDNRSLIAASPDPSRLSGGRAGDIQSSTICPETFNQPSYIPLKSCLVDLDVRGYRVLSSCLSEPRQLSFNQSNYSVNQDNQAKEPESLLEVALPNGQYVQYVTQNISEVSGQQQDAMDVLSQYSLYMEKDCRFFFQHPYARLFVAYFVIFCNFLIFAEDPVSHSHTESEIPVVGNVFAFVLTKYPPEWEWRAIKISLWIIAVLLGMAIGKHFIHKLILCRLCRLKMFHDEQGSWMIMFLTVIVLLYIFSHVYNACLASGHPNACKHQISVITIVFLVNSLQALMGATNSSVMKAAACGTWLGDFITAWMVSDMMLQDNLYPHWAPRIRAFWRTGNTRIVTFWGGSVGMSALVITLIVSDWINWDKLNRDFVATTELSRAFLASFILVMDLLIVMQDWDFPHFISTLDINLPGMKIKAVKLNFCNCPVKIRRFWRIHITGKWFNYGIIFLVMILDLNMWKNQIFYSPEVYGQYLGPDFKIYTVSDYAVLATGNITLWTYEWRSTTIDPKTNQSFLENDMLMNSRFLEYSLEEKCTAFIPSIIGFSIFFTLIYHYGRFPPKESENYGGRLKKRKKQYRSSWRRERGHFGIMKTGEELSKSLGLPLKNLVNLFPTHSKSQNETSRSADFNGNAV